MKKHPKTFRQPDIPRAGGYSEVTSYTLSREEIEARYGHLTGYTKRKELETTAPQTQPCRRRKA